MRYSVDTDTGYAHQDEGPWRSYEVVAEGNTLDELIADAHIFEIDQDGGNLNDYPLEETGGSLHDLAIDAIKLEIERLDS